MAKGSGGGPTKGTAVTGTRGDDVFVLLAGELTLNGSTKSYTSPLTLKGGAGNDSFFIDDPNAAIIDGGQGVDKLDFSTASAPVAVQDWGNGAGTYTNFDVVRYADLGSDPLHPEAYPTGGTKTAAPTGIEQYVGTAFDDLFSVGASGPTTINGGAGNDHVSGGVYNDTLLGGEGDDLLFGKAGSDTLSGGAGADKFYFVTMEGNGDDVVTDFNPTEGDHLYIGEQDAAPVGSIMWHDHDYNGDGIYDSVRADFGGVSITLLGWSTADEAFPLLNSSYTVFDFD